MSRNCNRGRTQSCAPVVNRCWRGYMSMDGGLATRRRLAACPTILLFLSVVLYGQSSPRIVYTKSFPGSVPAYVAIRVDSNGACTYNETKEEDDAEKLQLERDVTTAIFDLAGRLDHFTRTLESGLKVANMGAKTYRWEDGAETHQVTFNYSQDETAR